MVEDHERGLSLSKPESNGGDGGNRTRVWKLNHK